MGRPYKLFPPLWQGRQERDVISSPRNLQLFMGSYMYWQPGAQNKTTRSVVSNPRLPTFVCPLLTLALVSFPDLLIQHVYCLQYNAGVALGLGLRRGASLILVTCS